MTAVLSRRSLLKAGGALVVALGAGGSALAQVRPAKPVAADEVDGFIAVYEDGSVTLYCGKVDLGTGLRAAIPQMAAEELGIGLDRITLVEGDTAVTPDQGPTAGSTGVARGGVQIRQAAATAREALIRLAADRLGVPADQLVATEGEIRPKAGGKAGVKGIGFGALIGNGQFGLKVDPKAPLKKPADYTVVGKPVKRPDLPDKLTGRQVYMQDFVLPGMLHARVVRPPSVGAKLQEVDAASISEIPGAGIVRLKDFLAVVAEDEWDAVCALRQLKTRWSETPALIGNDRVRDWMKAGPFVGEDKLVGTGDAGAALGAAARKLSATYYWPLQSHASMGPSCAAADVREDGATIWSASQATHRFRPTIAKLLGFDPKDVRVVYLDGAGCYGMNGHDDAAADAALISKAVGRPVRVQWMREDEHGWDPKGPPQLLSLEAALSPEGRVTGWRTEMWLPKATANLPNMPLLAPEAAGLDQVQGLTTGLITQNGDPCYRVPNVEVVVHWLKDAPLRPSNIRAPGKIGNTFAVEGFWDELAAAAGRDPLEFRLDGVDDPRGVAVLKRVAALIGWQKRPAPLAGGGLGRGLAYIHYKHNEAYVAIAMEAEIERSSGTIHVRRVACAHDCGLMINPDAVRAQVEGNILQTLSRTLYEEVTFDTAKVTSVDWATYPILTFPDAPELLIDLIDHPSGPPLGAGEAASAPVAAALANAVFDAAAIRLRTVPFTPSRVKQALAHGQA